MIRVRIGTRSGEEEIQLSATDTLFALKQAFKKDLSPHRKSFKLITTDGRKFALSPDDALLRDLGVADGSLVEFKDLGPQVGYRTVFIVEYAGPLAFMLLFSTQPGFIYSSSPGLTSTQKMFAAAFGLHFVKRELETFFVHKFSRATMPLFNIVKNSVYYWSFAAVIGYLLCHPQYTPPASSTQSLLSLAAMAVFELGNFIVHRHFANLRPGKEGSDTSRKPPTGGLFSLVSCPNYTFEVLAWSSFSLGTNILMSWGFTAVGLAQMTDWALKKHRGYLSDPDCPSEVKRRKSIIPFVI